MLFSLLLKLAIERIKLLLFQKKYVATDCFVSFYEIKVENFSGDIGNLKISRFKRLYNVFDGDDVRSFKITFPKCRRVNSCRACTR